MVSSYQVGYFAGRTFTKIAKVHSSTKVINSAYLKLNKISKHHKIDSKNTEVVAENLFKCLEYLD